MKSDRPRNNRASPTDPEPSRSREPTDRDELKVILDFYDLMLYLIQRCEKFPRHHRYSLGIAIENRLQAILALLIKAKYTQRQTKRQTLAVVNTELEVLRFQLRLAKDLGALPIMSHGHASGLIEGIGAQIGGWTRSIGGGHEAGSGPLGERDQLGQSRARPEEGAPG
jgi:hypothetical protein